MSTSAGIVAAGAAGELVAYGFVPGAGLGLVQGVELAQRLELVGAGRDPHRFAQLGFPGGGGRGVGGELGPDDVVGVRVVDGVRGRVGERLGDPFPLAELGRAALVTGEVLVPGVLPGVEPGDVQGGRGHAPGAAPYPAAAGTGRIERLARHRDARGRRAAVGAPGRPGRQW
ncbi:hypothetical protein [Streptomyces sp. CA-256286]|uniref:hypothetical protein n=1 Tax=Streptomyces sp. CA-256286 TaxID=2801033 RepID=UPI001A997B26|nr:hypothetical protein [Streptomyces sp. CA-256286]